MLARRLAYLTTVLVLILFVLRHPAGAAHAATAIGHALAALADALATFTTAL